MDVLACLRVGGGQIDFGVATTHAEREALLAQRFRIYQRRGYYQPGLANDRDEYDDRAIYVLAKLRRRVATSAIVGSARFIVGEDQAGFSFPVQHAFEVHLPEALTAFPAWQCGEITRVVSEHAAGLGRVGLLTPLGLIQAVSLYSQRHDIRSGVALVKRRFFRALVSAGVLLHELAAARVIYPVDGPVWPYFYRHPDPVVPIYWLVAETAPTIARAIARYVERQRPTPSRLEESTRNDNESAAAR
jgi:N-acyl-L-homoserine lactone synthetase